MCNPSPRSKCHPSRRIIPPFRGQRLDLKAVYGFGTAQKDHSGQFQRNIQELYSKPDGTRFQTAFYRQLMEDLQVVP